MKREIEYNILSPDGFTIRQENFVSQEEAKEYLIQWIKRYEKQKYYSKNDGTKIPLSKVELFCKPINNKIEL